MKHFCSVELELDHTRINSFIMLGYLPAYAALVCACAASPLLAVCDDGAQCMEEYYCDTNAHVCRPCLKCQDLKRDSPVAPYQCIKSVAECGPCYKGLVPDLRGGGVNAECVPPVSSEDGGMTSYLWLFIVVGLTFIGLVVAIIIYVARNPEMFKTFAPSQPSFTARITASAPDAPPPYNPLPYKDTPPPAPPAAPPHYPYTDNGHVPAYGFGNNEGSRFIVHPAPPRPADGRVPDASQTAKVYDKPVYLREHRSPSPDLTSEPDEPARSPTDFTLDDEETLMSPWTHGGDVANHTNADGSAAAGGDPAPPALVLCDPAPAKKRCVRQDSNNNRNRESSSGESEANNCPRSPSPGQSAPAFGFTTQIFNIVNINPKK